MESLEGCGPEKVKFKQQVITLFKGTYFSLLFQDEGEKHGCIDQREERAFYRWGTATKNASLCLANAKRWAWRPFQHKGNFLTQRVNLCPAQVADELTQWDTGLILLLNEVLACTNVGHTKKAILGITKQNLCVIKAVFLCFS